MIINATEFKNNIGKYLKIANKEEVIISKSGKNIAKLVPISDKETPIVDSLLGMLKDIPKLQDVDLEKEREERLKNI